MGNFFSSKLFFTNYRPGQLSSQRVYQPPPTPTSHQLYQSPPTKSNSQPSTKPTSQPSTKPTSQRVYQPPPTKSNSQPSTKPTSQRVYQPPPTSNSQPPTSISQSPPTKSPPTKPLYSDRPLTEYEEKTVCFHCHEVFYTPNDLEYHLGIHYKGFHKNNPKYNLVCFTYPGKSSYCEDYINPNQIVDNAPIPAGRVVFAYTDSEYINKKYKKKTTSHITDYDNEILAELNAQYEGLSIKSFKNSESTNIGFGIETHTKDIKDITESIRFKHAYIIKAYLYADRQTKMKEMIDEIKNRKQTHKGTSRKIRSRRKTIKK
jgi:hypothetical protein